MTLSTFAILGFFLQITQKLHEVDKKSIKFPSDHVVMQPNQ